jgi:hypothetical protein
MLDDDSQAALLTGAEYDLRVEFTNLISAYVVVRRLRDVDRHAYEVLPDRDCPSAVALGAAAAFEHTWSIFDWRPVLTCSSASLRHKSIAAALNAYALIADRDAVRILAVPGLKLGSALLEVPSSVLRDVGLAVINLPGLSQRDMTRLIWRSRVNGLGTPKCSPRRARGGVAHDGVLLDGALDDDPTLDHVLHQAANAVIARTSTATRQTMSVLASLERLPQLRTVLLPTTALGVTRLVRDWAVARGVTVAAMQHGFYVYCDWDGADRLADVVLGWSPTVEEQMLQWPGSTPRLAVVGTPGLMRSARPPTERVAKVLVATTNSPLGTALLPWSYCHLYMAALAPGLRRLMNGGVSVTLRIHPSESMNDYKQLTMRLGLSNIHIGARGPFSVAAADNDLLISPESSVALEAGAGGMPVMMWAGALTPSLRRRYLVPPLSESLPATFSTSDEFEDLVARILKEPSTGLDDAYKLGQRLGLFAMPADRDALSDTLRELAA